jgi:hypothetical protein
LGGSFTGESAGAEHPATTAISAGRAYDRKLGIGLNHPGRTGFGKPHAGEHGVGILHWDNGTCIAGNPLD